MPGLVESKAYTASKKAMCNPNERVAALLDAIEWELMNADDFSCYPVIKKTKRGNVHSFQAGGDDPGVPPVVVLFGFETFPDARKVLLINCALATHAPGDAGD